jgi:hypothetical protein
LCYEHHVDRVLLYAENFTERFFDLASGEAGEILQKFRNYRIKVAAVLPANRARQGRFGEMVAEENRGVYFRVFEESDAAKAWLTQD